MKKGKTYLQEGAKTRQNGWEALKYVAGFSILFILCIILVVRYQENKISLEIQEQQLAQAKEKIHFYYTEMEQVLDTKEDVLNLTGSYMKDQKNIISQTNLNRLKILCEDSSFQDAFIITNTGTAINARGTKLQWDTTTYVRSMSKGQGRIVDYVDYNGDKHKEWVVMVPVMTADDGVKSIVGGVLRKQFFQEKIEKIAEEGITYYITDRDGEVLVQYAADTDADSSNLFQMMKKYGKDGKDITALQMSLDTGVQEVTVATAKGREKYFAYASVNEGSMCLFMVYDSADRNPLYADARHGYRVLITDILVLYVLFISLTAGGYFFITCRKIKYTEEHKRLAEVDALTTVYNKMAVAQYVNQCIAAMEQEEYCVLFVADLDNFKILNDTKGHNFGDEVLKEIGNGIKSEFRATDIIGRIGGDEFVVFLKYTENDVHFMQMQGEKLVTFFHQLCQNDGSASKLTASIGGVICMAKEASFENLYRMAAQACYQAKQKGKDQYVLYSEL